MKQGKSLIELAKELETMRETSRDFIVPVEGLGMTNDASLLFTNGEKHEYTPNSWAHYQLGQYTGIPKNYYDRILSEDKALLATNVNHCLTVEASRQRKDGKPESRMVRTTGGKVRALLSSSYRRLDSWDMCNEILPVLADKQMQVIASEITDKRLYIKALSPKITAEVKKGDVVQYGLVISNSDVGAGSVRVEPLVYRLVCLNGMISDTAMRKFHVGRNQAELDVYELLTDQTRAMNDSAFWATVRDVTLSSMREEVFERQVDRLRVAANEPIKNFDIPRVIELSMKATGIAGDKTKDSMIAYLANGADGAGLTRWGLVNAFTYAAQREDLAYDDSIDLERAGAKVLDLPANQWKTISAVGE
jgi:hypothetical protein